MDKRHQQSDAVADLLTFGMLIFCCHTFNEMKVLLCPRMYDRTVDLSYAAKVIKNSTDSVRDKIALRQYFNYVTL